MVDGPINVGKGSNTAFTGVAQNLQPIEKVSPIDQDHTILKFDSKLNQLSNNAQVDGTVRNTSIAGQKIIQTNVGDLLIKTNLPINQGDQVVLKVLSTGHNLSFAILSINRREIKQMLNDIMLEDYVGDPSILLSLKGAIPPESKKKISQSITIELSNLSAGSKLSATLLNPDNAKIQAIISQAIESQELEDYNDIITMDKDIDQRTKQIILQSLNQSFSQNNQVSNIDNQEHDSQVLLETQDADQKEKDSHMSSGLAIRPGSKIEFEVINIMPDGKHKYQASQNVLDQGNTSNHVKPEAVSAPTNTPSSESETNTSLDQDDHIPEVPVTQKSNKQQITQDVKSSETNTIQKSPLVIKGKYIATNKSFVITTDIGLLQVEANDYMPEDSTITLKLSNIILDHHKHDYMYADNQPQAYLVSLYKNWYNMSYLVELMRHSPDHNQLNIVPQIDDRLIIHLFNFASIYKRRGNLLMHMSSESQEVFLENVGEEIVQKIDKDFSYIFASINRAYQNEHASISNHEIFRSYIFPIHDQGIYYQILLHIREDSHLAENKDSEEDSEEDQRDDKKNTRFVVEMENELFGLMQIDGLISKQSASKELNLVIRTTNDLDDHMQQGIMQIFNTVNNITKASGQLSFEKTDEYSAILPSGLDCNLHSKGKEI